MVGQGTSKNRHPEGYVCIYHMSWVESYTIYGYEYIYEENSRQMIDKRDYLCRSESGESTESSEQ